MIVSHRRGRRIITHQLPGHTFFTSNRFCALSFGCLSTSILAGTVMSLYWIKGRERWPCSSWSACICGGAFHQANQCKKLALRRTATGFILGQDITYILQGPLHLTLRACHSANLPISQTSLSRHLVSPSELLFLSFCGRG